MEWDYKVLDPVAFPLEHLRYNEMLENGREDLIDPLWIACFCMVRPLSYTQLSRTGLTLCFVSSSSLTLSSDSRSFVSLLFSEFL